MKNAIPIITILAIGAFVGNMLNIGLSHANYWQSLNPIEFMHFFAIDFPLLLIPTAVTVMPAWLGTLWLFVKAEKTSESRRMWLFAVVSLTLVLAQTSIYHLPMNLNFMDLKYDEATATSQLNGWIISHWIRVVISTIAGIYALKAYKLTTK